MHSNVMALGIALLVGGPLAVLAGAQERRQGPGPDGPPSGGRGPGGGPPPLEHVLQLDDRQKAAVEKLREEHREATRPVMDEQRRLGDDLRQALDSSQADPQAIGQKTIALHANRKRLEAAREQLDERIMALLDDRQKERFKEMRERRPGPPPHGGPGAPGGPRRGGRGDGGPREGGPRGEGR